MKWSYFHPKPTLSFISTVWKRNHGYNSPHHQSIFHCYQKWYNDPDHAFILNSDLSVTSIYANKINQPSDVTGSRTRIIESTLPAKKILFVDSHVQDDVSTLSLSTLSKQDLDRMLLQLNCLNCQLSWRCGINHPFHLTSEEITQQMTVRDKNVSTSVCMVHNTNPFTSPLGFNWLSAVSLLSTHRKSHFGNNNAGGSPSRGGSQASQENAVFRQCR